MQILRRYPAEALACFVWLAYAALETWIASGAVLLAAIWALHGLALMLLMKAILVRVPRDHDVVRVAIFIFVAIAFTLLQTVIDMLATQFIGQRVLGTMPEAGISPIGIRFDVAFKLNMRVYLWIFGFYAATLALLGSMRETYDARLQKDRAELDALRLQVNPHLLFNALNSISSLIIKGDLRQADRMTMELARFYRGNLTTGVSDIVCLDEEIEALDAYIDFETLRFEKLAIIIDCPEPLWNAQVPRLILQPLVENAIKFGGTWRDDVTPITVVMSAQSDKLEIRIENSFSSATAADGTGTGLSNVRNRLRFYFGDRAALVTSVNDGRWSVLLAMPLTLRAASPA